MWDEAAGRVCEPGSGWYAERAGGYPIVRFIINIFIISIHRGGMFRSRKLNHASLNLEALTRE